VTDFTLKYKSAAQLLRIIFHQLTDTACALLA